MKRLVLVLFSFAIFSCDDTLTAENSSTISCDQLYNNLELPSFYLQDLNLTSSTYNQFIQPQDFDGRVRLIYFTETSNWPICLSTVVSLNTLYNEYKNSAILNDIIVIGIGKDNDESIDQITSGNDLPWLKDNNSEFNQVWDNWGVANRDLIFLNKQGEYKYKLNLTSQFSSTEINSIIDCLDWNVN